MAFPPSRVESITDLVLFIANDIFKGEPADIVTPNTQLWNRWKNEKGMIQRRPPGRNFVEDLLYNTPDRTYAATLTNDVVTEEYASFEAYTEATYYWVMLLQNLQISLPALLNCTGPHQVADIVTRKKKPLDISFQQKLASIMWNGFVTEGATIFGLTDYIQTSTTSNPTKGAVGGLDQTSATLGSSWKNQVMDFNAPYKYVDTGATYTNLFAGSASASLMAMWRACSNNQDGAAGEPDLIVCNDVFEEQIANLTDTRLIHVNQDKNLRVSSEGYFFRSAQIMYDSLCPTETASEGCAYFINTRVVGPVFAEGLERGWLPKEKIPGKTAYQWPMFLQFSTYCKNRRMLGVFFGVQAASIS